MTPYKPSAASASAAFASFGHVPKLSPRHARGFLGRQALLHQIRACALEVVAHFIVELAVHRRATSQRA
jgi:hypothetical protein